MIRLSVPHHAMFLAPSEGLQGHRAVLVTRVTL